ncbi:MAG TPA: hypothetical protein VFZ34_17720 [Blastocatellia bacterium]|nr:hypothetical protein [Blastocatellia bacterium]
MTTSIMNSISIRLVLGLAVIMSAFIGQALAQGNKSWTTVASAGTVNDQDIGKIELSGGGLASFNAAAAASDTAYLRYNVTAVDGLFVAGSPRMRVRFQDNGGNAQVVVALMELNLITGLPKKILELDSNNFAAAPSLQVQKTGICDGFGNTFNFTDKAYYIEARLVRTAAGGFPRLAAIQLYNDPDANCVP